MLGHPYFSSLAPPLPHVPYISHATTFSRVYNVLPRIQQAACRDTVTKGGREGESVSGFQRWLGSLHLTRAGHSCSSPFFQSLFLPFFVACCFSRLRTDYKQVLRSCSLVTGSSSPRHRDGLYYRPPGLSNPAPVQLGTGGGPVPGGWRCQSAWGALLSWASVTGHWGHGEVLVPLHLSLWNHFFGDRCSRNGCNLHL